MKTFLQNLGPLIMLIGVIILAIYYFKELNSNAMLLSAGGVMVLGFVLHIILNRKVI